MAILSPRTCIAFSVVNVVRMLFYLVERRFPYGSFSRT
jgi:hypothetical protein